MLINTVRAIVHDVGVSITFDMYDIWQGSLNRRAANRTLQSVFTKREICTTTPNRPRNHSRYKTQSLIVFHGQACLKCWEMANRVACICAAAQERDNLGRNTGRPAGQLPGKPTYKGRSEVTGIIVNLVPVNSGIHKQ